MTKRASLNQKSHAKGILCLILCILEYGLVLALPSHAATSEWQSIQSIEQAALRHIENELSGKKVRTESHVRALDRRLKLARCGKPLETFSPAIAGTAAGSGGTQTIGVRCQAPKPWKIFVPISTVSYRQVVVASRFLQKGETVSAEDVHLEERDITRILNGYLTDPTQLQGRILKRPIRENSIISQTALGTEDMVKRGQKVTLMARNSKLQVRMRGEALNSAGLNERVRVKNLTSRRTVEGTVVSRQLVLVDH